MFYWCIFGICKPTYFCWSCRLLVLFDLDNKRASLASLLLIKYEIFAKTHMEYLVFTLYCWIFEGCNATTININKATLAFGGSIFLVDAFFLTFKFFILSFYQHSIFFLNSEFCLFARCHVLIVWRGGVVLA